VQQQLERPGLEFEVLARSDDYAVQRGLEQRAMDQYQPYLNKIRGVSLKNKKLNDYLYAADKIILEKKIKW
jgi:hypothetical protein